MTIAIGFTCVDALLICADTQLTVAGVTKLHGSKIFREEFPNGAKSAIAIAGTLSLGRMAMQHIEQRIGDQLSSDLTLRKIRSEIEEEVQDMHQRHIHPHPDRYTLNLSFQLLLAVWSPVDSRSMIFWTEGTAVNELRGYQPIGAGDSLAHYVIKEEGYRPTMPEAEVRRIAIRALAMAKDYVDGCGGFTEMISMSNSGTLGHTERLPIPATP